MNDGNEANIGHAKETADHNENHADIENPREEDNVRQGATSDVDDVVIPQMRPPLPCQPEQSNPLHENEGNENQNPGVEWIHPSGNDGILHDFLAENIQQESNGDDDNISAATYVVDPNNVYVAEDVIEGVVLHPRRCYIKILGFEACSDSYTFMVNPKLLFVFFLIGVVVIVLLTTTNFRFPSNNIIENEQNSTSASIAPTRVHSLQPSYAPIDPRVEYITQILLEVSGEAVLVDGSAQNKALKWILHDDERNLTYSDHNLAQRYTMMVYYYSLSGENWYNSNQFGSESHECSWYGVSCNQKKHITKLVHSSNNLRGQIPKEIHILSSLWSVLLDENALSGTIPTEIGLLTSLQSLNLNSNRISGTIPEGIEHCKILQFLLLQRNSLIGTIPTTFGRLRGLRELHLVDNQLTGEIPTELGGMRSVETMNLSSNQLSGTIPSELGEATSINQLNINQNNLNGSIPSTFGNLWNLVNLRLSQNSLTGTIPPQLFKLSRIRQLHLDHNQLSGTIPDSMGFSSTLLNMYLNQNMITGTIPSSFGLFPRLHTLDVQFTNLSGSVPASICDLRLDSLKADCAGENPEILCSCCTECFL